MSSKRTAQSFTQSCAGAKFLKDQFELHEKDSSRGLDPSIVKPKEIRDIYNRHPEFHPYSFGSFPTNYKNHATLFQINKAKSRAEKDQKANTHTVAVRKAGEYLIFIQCINNEHKTNFFFIFFQDEIVGDIERPSTPEKKQRVSFQDEDKESEHGGKSIDLLSPGAVSTTSSQFSYQQITHLDAEEEEDDDAIVGLADQIKEMDIKKKAGRPLVWKAMFPFLLTQWKDSRDRHLVTIEIHLPSGSIPDDFHMELKVRGGNQLFCLHHRISNVFLDQNHFDHSIGELQMDNGQATIEAEKDSAALSLARAATIRDLKKKYTDKTDLDKNYIHMHTEIELPMLCEDIFTTHGYQGDYPNCCQIYRVIPTEDENGDDMDMHILIVTLVGVRYEDNVVTRRNTPQRNNNINLNQARVRRGGGAP